MSCGNWGFGFFGQLWALVVRKNSGAELAGRRRLNLVEGTGISLAVADAPGQNEVGATVALTTPVAVTNGGTGTGTAFTAGAVVFAGASGVYAQDAALFAYSAGALGLGTVPVAGQPLTMGLAQNAATICSLTNPLAGASAEAQFRATNDQGAIAYQGISSSATNFGGTVLDGGRGFWLSFLVPAVFGSQSAQPVIFAQSLAEVARIDTSGHWVLGGAGLAAASLLDLFTGTLTLSANSSTATKRSQADLVPGWVDATDATRKARLVFDAYDTAARECLRIEATGTAPAVGFLGAAAVARQNTTGTTAGFSAGAGTAVVSGSTFTGNTGATAYTVGDVVRALKNYGLLAS